VRTQTSQPVLACDELPSGRASLFLAHRGHAGLDKTQIPESKILNYVDPHFIIQLVCRDNAWLDQETAFLR